VLTTFTRLRFRGLRETNMPKTQSSPRREEQSFRPLPPPRKNKVLLTAAALLVLLWIVFLLSLVLKLFE
jgi:hypothetical protein